MFTYYAIAELDDSGTWVATFPDFPGVRASSSSFEVLRLEAKKALAAHLTGLLDRSGLTPSDQATVTCVTPGAGQHLLAIDIAIV